MRRALGFLAIVLASRLAPAATARLAVDPAKAHIGDALTAVLTVTLEPGESLDSSPLQVSWGSAQVLSGAWTPVAPGTTARVWRGSIAVYELGAVTIPPVEVAVKKGGAQTTVASEPVSLHIEATLPASTSGEKPPELIDLKPPASIPPDYRPLKGALLALAGLLAAAGAAWWLWRRYAAKLAAVRAPVDPFRKLAPHVWVYEELEKLLARRLAEEGRIGLFYDELTRIVKQYLEGRYRVELLERTTSEVQGALQHAGAPQEAGTRARALLESGDRVKFARLSASPAECRTAVEEAYRLVDVTKPVEVAVESTVAAASR